MSRLLVLVVAAVPVLARAGGYLVPNLNPRDLGMGSAATAAQDSAAAVYANSASLSRLADGLHLSLADCFIDYNSSYRDPAGVQPNAGLRDNFVWPPALYAAYAGAVKGHRVGGGIGFTLPAGGNVYWPSGWAGRFEIVSVDRKVYAWYATVGVEVVPEILRIGGGFVYYRTTEKLVQGANFVTSEGTTTVGTVGSAPSFDVSADVTPLRGVPLRFGLDYKHQAIQTLHGDVHFSSPPIQFGPLALDQKVDHELPFPNVLQIGASYRPIPPLLLAFTFTFERWVVYKEDLFVGSLGTTLTVPRDWHNGQVYRAGAEYDVTPKLTLRVGGLRGLSPTRSDTNSATVPDSNVWGVAGGASYKVTPVLAFHAGYAYDNLTPITSTGNRVFPATYESSAHLASLGVTWSVNPFEKK
jgi:long-chain fatty acid transport protein